MIGVLSQAFAQSSKEIPVTFNLWKYPMAKLPASARTFSVNWDIGSRQASSFVEFADYKYVKENADLKINIIVGNITLSDPVLYEFNKNSNKYYCYYGYKCNGPFSLTITNSKDSVIVKKSWTSYAFSTKTYNNFYNLQTEQTKFERGYAFDKVVSYLESVLKTDFKFYAYSSEFDLKSVDEEDPIYKNLNKTIDSVAFGISKLEPSATTPFANPIITNNLAKLKPVLSKIDFSTKKGPTGKKVGNCILQTLVVGYLAVGDYKSASEYIEMYKSENSGLFSANFSGKTYDKSYTGYGTISTSILSMSKTYYALDPKTIIDDYLQYWNTYNGKF